MRNSSIVITVGALLASVATPAISWGQADTTLLVSRQSAADGGAGATGGFNGSDFASISADGRFVAFVSDATNLSTADTNDPFEDVYVRDLQTDTTTLVSRQSAADGGAVGDLDSYDAAISADGRFVAFSSKADNLSGADLVPRAATSSSATCRPTPQPWSRARAPPMAAPAPTVSPTTPRSPPTGATSPSLQTPST